MDVQGTGCRVVWFPAQGVDVDIPTFFESLLGEEPEVIRKNRAPSATNPTLATAESFINGAQFSLNFQPGRIELSITPESGREYQTIPVLDLSHQLNYVRARLMAAAWLPEAVRISCIVVKRIDADSADGASDLFCKYLGFNHGVVGATDLLFQINRRSDYAGVLANRVTTVSAPETQSITLRNGELAQPKRHFGIDVQLDFNTVPDGARYSAEDQKRIFDLMIDSVFAALAVDGISFLKD